MEIRNYILFWLAKPAAVLLLALLALLVSICAQIPSIIKQARCKHEHVRETMACDAICTGCGKNLGFIQNWRDAKRTREQGK